MLRIAQEMVNGLGRKSQKIDKRSLNAVLRKSHIENQKRYVNNTLQYKRSFCERFAKTITKNDKTFK